MDFSIYLTKTGRLKRTQPQEVQNEWYISRFKSVHGERYDYSLVNYNGAHTNILIVCPRHGLFEQTPNNHSKGYGCSDCSLEQKTKSLDKCLQDFYNTHGNTYGYEKVQYKNAHTDVLILCYDHGEFLQTPDNHIQGKGCPKCQIKNQHTLYILRCLNTGYVKIGITNNLDRRIQSIGGTLEYIYSKEFLNPRRIEKHIHAMLIAKRVRNRSVTSGYTEFFSLSDAEIHELIQYISSHQDDSLL